MKTWLSDPPTECDLCQTPITTIFIDGKTTYGPWGIMCPHCYKTYGKGLGGGLGQKYELQDGKFVKIAG